MLRLLVAPRDLGCSSQHAPRPGPSPTPVADPGTSAQNTCRVLGSRGCQQGEGEKSVGSGTGDTLHLVKLSSSWASGLGKREVMPAVCVRWTSLALPLSLWGASRKARHCEVFLWLFFLSCVAASPGGGEAHPERQGR